MNPAGAAVRLSSKRRTHPLRVRPLRKLTTRVTLQIVDRPVRIAIHLPAPRQHDGEAN